MVAASGTIEINSSRTTAGDTSNLPSVWVCWVATLHLQPGERRLAGGGQQTDEFRYPPLTRRPTSFEIACPLHVARDGFLRAGQRLLSGCRACGGRREELPDLGAQSLELGDSHELDPD